MTIEPSQFGRRLASTSGIEILMDDLGRAMADAKGSVRMLGGGNPAHIPEIELVWRRRMAEILADGESFERMLGNYDPPRGNARFLDSLAGLLRREFGWDVSADNLAVTSGGQTAFFYLFNLLAGDMPHGKAKKILLPVVPEYIGYANQGAGPGIFSARRPRLDFPAPHRFKYGVDFDNLNIGDDIAAVCVSRPTNPTGNVLTDGEVHRLAAICRERGIPLILDNAYGMPFPHIIFSEATPYWDENTILTMSLSKLGLPGTRTGVVVAQPAVAKAIQSLTAVTGLANGNIGQAIVEPLIASGEILRLSREVIQPYYRAKAAHALRCVDEYFADAMDYHVHANEGALFLWLWFKDLPITSKQFYERLKKRGVLVVPGEHFFFGLDDPDWAHSRECLRVSFAMADEDVRAGLEIIAGEALKAYGA
jgi:valine--pyruvate aminotransferase